MPRNKLVYWIWGVLIGLDQLANALLWPLLNMTVQNGGVRFGNPDETLSSVMGKNVELGKCRFCVFVCLVLNRLDRQHCSRSIEADEHSPYK